jgi:uncharacterized phage protein (TIGR02218 family)
MESTLCDHLRTGSTTVCRAWKVVRHDGAVLGFTDHDRDLAFDEVIFLARTGLTARALQQTTGMSVDNTEAMGALSDASVREEDILAGRFDGAEVTAFLVNWEDVTQRNIQFKGNFGEITRANGMFQVELRGLSERLNRPVGRVYHAECSAELGDRRCAIDITEPAYSITVPILRTEEGRVFSVMRLPAFAARWFERGRLVVIDGAGRDQSGLIKTDRLLGDVRVIEMWQTFSTHPQPGDSLRLEVGCDKRGDTCRNKFSNFLNFRGFPHIPGEDWLRAVPRTTGRA